MIGVDIHVFDDEKLFEGAFKTIKLTQMPLLANLATWVTKIDILTIVHQDTIGAYLYTYMCFWQSEEIDWKYFQRD